MYHLPENFESFGYNNIENIHEKRVILRSGLNVAVDSEGRVTDQTRLIESLPLIIQLAGEVKRLVILGHLGRPEAGNFENKFGFWNLAELMQKEINKVNKNIEVKLVKEFTEINDEANTVFLMENIRFYEGEESKDPEKRKTFAKELSELGEIFINDAFADYRESASTYEIAKILPSYLGPVFFREVKALSKFTQPIRPFVAVLGGAKLSEKLDTLNALAENADKVVIGGAMAYTLMKAQGLEVGKSLVEEDKIEVANEILSKFSEKLILPIDHMIADEFKADSKFSYTQDEIIPNDKLAIDIGSETIEVIKSTLNTAGSILWNGPMGVFEWEHSAKGTYEVGAAIESNRSAYKLVGGGDSIAAINKLGLKGFDHISTGGGAMLAYLAYDTFPTLDVIVNKK